MKLSFLLELLFILIIIAFAASKPISSDLRLKRYPTNSLTSRQSGTSTNEITPGGGGGGSDNDDDDDDDFGLGDDDDDDDDDDEPAGEKEKEPQKGSKPEESDEVDDILGLDDDEDEKDTPSEEEDADGDDFLLFGDDFFDLFDDDDDNKKTPTPAQVTSAAISSIQASNPVNEAIPASPQISVVKQKPAPAVIAEVAPSKVTNVVTQAATQVVDEVKEKLKPTQQLDLPHTPALIELSQTAMAQGDTISGSDKNSVPEQSVDSSVAEVVGEDASTNADSQVQSIEIIKAEDNQENNDDDSVEEEGMIVVSDATLGENDKNSENTDIKQTVAQSNVAQSPIFHNDKDMDVVDQISHIALQLSTPTVATKRPPKKKKVEKEEEGILGIVDSLISDEDDDDDDLKLEEEDGNKDEATEDLEDAIQDDSEEEGDEAAEVEESEGENVVDNKIKDSKKKKRKQVGFIGSLSQSLGFTRTLKSKRKH